LNFVHEFLVFLSVLIFQSASFALSVHKFSFVLRVSLLLQVLRWPLFLCADFCPSCISGFLFPALVFSTARLLSGFPSRRGDESRCPFSFCSSRSALRPDFSAPDLSVARCLLRFREQACHSVVDLTASCCPVLAQVSPACTGARRLRGLRFSPLGIFLSHSCCSGSLIVSGRRFPLAGPSTHLLPARLSRS
jgi:hypothetical protein